MLFLKEVLDYLGLFLPSMEMTVHRREGFGPVSRADSTQPVDFDVLGQEFIRIEFGTVAGWTDELESCGVLSYEPCHDCGAMHGTAVHNEIEPAANRLQQSC